MSARIERLVQELTATIREEVAAMPENVLTLGEELLAARQRSRMSLQEVADRSGFTKSHVWEVEKGRSRNPTVGMISGLSKALGVPFLRLAQAALNSSEAPTLSPSEASAGNLPPDEPVPSGDAASAPPCKSEWRPIESAPRDGTDILVYFAPITGRITGAWKVSWENLYGERTPEDGSWCVDDNKHGPYPLRGYCAGDATHWQPLPASPLGEG